MCLWQVGITVCNTEEHMIKGVNVQRIECLPLKAVALTISPFTRFQQNQF